MTDPHNPDPAEQDPLRSTNGGFDLTKPGTQPQAPPYASQPAYTLPGADSRGAYYPPAAPGNYAPYNQQRPDSERLSGLALAGFIVALASPIFYFLIVPAPVGLVLSIIGLVRDVKGRGMRGRGFAITGIIVSSVFIVLALLIVAGLIIYGVHHAAYCQQNPTVGSCVDDYNGYNYDNDYNDYGSDPGTDL